MAINILDEEISNLYSVKPVETLYHYTSLNNLMGIVKSKTLFTTDIRFFNDSAEIQHLARLLQDEISKKLQKQDGKENLFLQLKNWINNRLKDINGYMLFVGSFTTNGNLLSQWRGYCQKNKGVSVGFNANEMLFCVETNGFSLGRCIYDINEQKSLANRIIEAIEELAIKKGENSKRNPSESFHDIFEDVEHNLLKIAALLKNPAFQEENEWRIVSSIYSNYVEAPICYREGLSMLVPYIEFSLPKSNESLLIEEIILGPTPNINHSMTSLSRYLTKYNANPKKGLHYCQIPYREW